MRYSSEMNVKQNDQQREDMQVFPEVSVQCSVVFVGIDVDRREFRRAPADVSGWLSPPYLAVALT